MKGLIKISSVLFLISGILLSSCSKKDDVDSVLITFDSLSLTPGSYWNGSDASGGFKIKEVSFSNSYNAGNSSWSGFAYSNIHDIDTTGKHNLYSCYAKKDSGSNNTFILYSLKNNTEGIVFDNLVYDVKLKITNSTYAALSMKYGKENSKKFGGADSTSKDWFKLLIIGVDAVGTDTDTAKVFLADYRYSSWKDDYIINEWLPMNLAYLHQVKKLRFELTSSDNGDAGMNTPAYFCIDDLEYKPVAKTE